MSYIKAMDDTIPVGLSHIDTMHRQKTTPVLEKKHVQNRTMGYRNQIIIMFGLITLKKVSVIPVRMSDAMKIIDKTLQNTLILEATFRRLCP